MEYQGETLTVSATSADQNAIVIVSGGPISAEDSTAADYTVTVTAENGAQKQYTYTLYTMRVFTLADAVTAITSRTKDVFIKVVGTVNKYLSGMDDAIKKSDNAVSLDLSAIRLIYSGTLSSCTSLKSITMPSALKTITKGMFYGCTSLENITIPCGVTSIGNSAFWVCSKLTNITIPKSVTSIEEEAFSSCGRLESITIPSSVTHIGNNAFSYCLKLASITFKGTTTQWNRISKELEWAKNVATGCTVTCTDDTVAVN